MKKKAKSRIDWHGLWKECERRAEMYYAQTGLYMSLASCQVMIRQLVESQLARPKARRGK